MRREAHAEGTKKGVQRPRLLPACLPRIQPPGIRAEEGDPMQQRERVTPDQDRAVGRSEKSRGEKGKGAQYEAKLSSRIHECAPDRPDLRNPS